MSQDTPPVCRSSAVIRAFDGDDEETLTTDPEAEKKKTEDEVATKQSLNAILNFRPKK